MNKKKSMEDLIYLDSTAEESFVAGELEFDWAYVVNIARITTESLELEFEDNYTDKKDSGVASVQFRIKYYTALTVLHTQPLQNVVSCKAYNLIASVMETGSFLIFGDWCLYYGLNERDFIDRWQTSEELQLVWTFFDTLYNKLATLRIIDNNTLKRYESSRAKGHFLPYTERAIIIDTVSKTQILLNRGEELSKQLMEE